ncbi:MAG: hypothetical protein DHS20C09_07750 [marine bacterium B5-7]|nr:MAG: hypothetical protein DHS20C09_07750 [marine bacterium B5-7]
MNKTIILIICISTLSTNVALAYQAFTENGFDLSDSIVPRYEIEHGGPPRDVIPALTDPLFTPVNKDKVKEDSRVLGVYVNGIAKAYPLKIMNWHEIVNDKFDDQAVLITYCPLCFSGIAFNPVFNGKRHFFGVSGLLYNSDVLLYDRQTESLWSQIMSKAISGKYVNQVMETFPVVNTTLRAWLAKHPDSLILSKETGYARNYEADPYFKYRQSNELMFSVKFRSQGYHPKELVLGISLNDISKAYPLSELSRADGFIKDNIAGKEIYISYNKDEQSGIISDSDCKLLPAITMFWFAWYAFNPETEIFDASKYSQPSDIDHCK